MSQNCAGCFKELEMQNEHVVGGQLELSCRHIYMQEWVLVHVRNTWLTPVNPGASQTFTNVPNPENK